MSRTFQSMCGPFIPGQDGYRIVSVPANTAIFWPPALSPIRDQIFAWRYLAVAVRGAPGACHIRMGHPDALDAGTTDWIMESDDEDRFGTLWLFGPMPCPTPADAFVSFFNPDVESLVELTVRIGSYTPQGIKTVPARLLVATVESR